MPRIDDQHHRRSPRLQGFDYAQEGAYFVTICMAGRRCILGEIVDGRMVTSETGKIVEECWREIPVHFPNVRTGAFQVMPDHVHGILEIMNRVGTRHATQTAGRHAVSAGESCQDLPPTNPVGAQHAAPLQGTRRGSLPAPGSLGAIIRSFKSAVTKTARERNVIGPRPLWQRSFHDRVIRDDKEQFFIEQYITLNPLIWHLERQCMAGEPVDPEDLRRRLKEEAGLDDYAAELVIGRWNIEY